MGAARHLYCALRNESFAFDSPPRATRRPAARSHSHACDAAAQHPSAERTDRRNAATISTIASERTIHRGRRKSCLISFVRDRVSSLCGRAQAKPNTSRQKTASSKPNRAREHDRKPPANRNIYKLRQATTSLGLPFIFRFTCDKNYLPLAHAARRRGRAAVKKMKTKVTKKKKNVKEKSERGNCI